MKVIFDLQLAVDRKPEVVGEQTSLAAQGTDVDHILAMGAGHHREFDGLAIDG